LWLLAQVDAHEGPVYFADEHALYFTSGAAAGRRPLTLGSDQTPAARRAA
jgi:hypothetical protein